MHISAASTEESVTPGTYAGIAWDLSTVAANFQPMLGGTGSLCTFVTGSLRKTHEICNICSSGEGKMFNESYNNNIVPSHSMTRKVR